MFAFYVTATLILIQHFFQFCGDHTTKQSCLFYTDDTGLYFTLRDKTYHSGDTVLLKDIGTVDGTRPSQLGRALVCITTNINTQCCRTRDGGNLGEWFFPNGTMVPRGNNHRGSAFTRRGSTQQVRLIHRLRDARGPLGEYQCRVPDSSGVLHTASVHIQLGEL